jgi:hypothetical protein
MNVIRQHALRFTLCLWAGLVPLAAFAEATHRPGDFTVAFASGAQLRVRAGSGEVRIVGSDRDRIAVHYSGRDAARSDEVDVAFRHHGNASELEIKGAPHNEFVTIIEVPRSTNLNVRMPFGVLVVSDVVGNKDVEVHSGALTIDVAPAEQYSRVEASIYAGDLRARPFAVDKSGLFRSFARHGEGRYALRAHLGAGELTLR